MPRYRRDKKSNLKKLVKSIVAKNIETKTSIFRMAGIGIGASGLAPINASFNDLNIGDNQYERTGNQVTLTSVKWDMFLTGADATNSIRCIVYIPKNPTVFLAIPFNGAVDFDSFTVLRDMFICTSNTGNNCVRRNGYISFKNRGKSLGMKTQWSGALASGQTKNRVLLYMVSDSLVVPHPEVNGVLHTFYKDA